MHLSRNFGENYAITAGLSFAKGDWVVVMDCDLQNRPEDVPLLYAKAQEGYDIVYARRIDKKFGFFTRSISNFPSFSVTSGELGRSATHCREPRALLPILSRPWVSVPPRFP